jgi:hypothetical protein
MCSLNLNLIVYRFVLYNRGYKRGISVDKCHYVRACCCYGVSDVKCCEMCCWYEFDCEVCIAEKKWLAYLSWGYNKSMGKIVTLATV